MNEMIFELPNENFFISNNDFINKVVILITRFNCSKKSSFLDSKKLESTWGQNIIFKITVGSIIIFYIINYKLNKLQLFNSILRNLSQP